MPMYFNPHGRSFGEIVRNTLVDMFERLREVFGSASVIRRDIAREDVPTFDIIDHGDFIEVVAFEDGVKVRYIIEPPRSDFLHSPLRKSVKTTLPVIADLEEIFVGSLSFGSLNEDYKYDLVTVFVRDLHWRQALLLIAHTRSGSHPQYATYCIARSQFGIQQMYRCRTLVGMLMLGGMFEGHHTQWFLGLSREMQLVRERLAPGLPQPSA